MADRKTSAFDTVAASDIPDTAYVPVVDPNEATLADRNQRTLWSSLKSFFVTATSLTTTLGSYVAKSLFNANTILAANSDDTPAALTVAEQTLVGRITGGNIDALTVAEASALLSSAGATALVSTNTTQGVTGIKTFSELYAVRMRANQKFEMLISEDTEFTSDQSDWQPNSAPIHNISSDAPRAIDSIIAGNQGQLEIDANAGSFSITYTHQDAGETANNRILCDTGSDIVLAPDEIVLRFYDSKVNRWRATKLSVDTSAFATAAQGALADSALQTETVEAYSGQGPFTIREISQAAYDALSPPDDDTLYLITS